MLQTSPRKESLELLQETFKLLTLSEIKLCSTVVDTERNEIAVSI